MAELDEFGNYVDGTSAFATPAPPDEPPVGGAMAGADAARQEAADPGPVQDLGTRQNVEDRRLPGHREDAAGRADASASEETPALVDFSSAVEEMVRRDNTAAAAHDAARSAAYAAEDAGLSTPEKRAAKARDDSDLLRFFGDYVEAQDPQGKATEAASLKGEWADLDRRWQEYVDAVKAGRMEPDRQFEASIQGEDADLRKRSDAWMATAENIDAALGEARNAKAALDRSSALVDQDEAAAGTDADALRKAYNDYAASQPDPLDPGEYRALMQARSLPPDDSTGNMVNFDDYQRAATDAALTPGEEPGPLAGPPAPGLFTTPSGQQVVQVHDNAGYSHWSIPGADNPDNVLYHDGGSYRAISRTEAQQLIAEGAKPGQFTGVENADGIAGAAYQSTGTQVSPGRVLQAGLMIAAAPPDLDLQKARAWTDFDTELNAEASDYWRKANELNADSTYWYQGGNQAGPINLGGVRTRTDGTSYLDLGWIPASPQQEQTYFAARYGHDFAPETDPGDKMRWTAMETDIREKRELWLAGQDPAVSTGGQGPHPEIGEFTGTPETDLFDTALQGPAPPLGPLDILKMGFGAMNWASNTISRAGGVAVSTPDVFPFSLAQDTLGLIGYARTRDLASLNQHNPDAVPIHTAQDLLGAIPFILGGDTSNFTPNTKAYFDFVGPTIKNTFVPTGAAPFGGANNPVFSVPVLGGFWHASASLLSVGPVEQSPAKIYADIVAGMSREELARKYPASMGPQLVYDLFLDPINYLPIPGAEHASALARRAIVGDATGRIGEYARQLITERSALVRDAGFAETALGGIEPKLAARNVDLVNAIIDHGTLFKQDAGVRDLLKGELTGYDYLTVNERQFLKDVYAGAQYDYSVGKRATGNGALLDAPDAALLDFIKARAEVPRTQTGLRAIGDKALKDTVESETGQTTAGFDAGARAAQERKIVEAWAASGRQTRAGTIDPFGAATARLTKAENLLDIGKAQLGRNSIGALKLGVLTLNPAYYLANIMTNLWQGLQYGVFVRPLHTQGIESLLDRLYSIAGKEYRSPRQDFFDKWQMHLDPGEGIVRDLFGVERNASELGLYNSFKEYRDAGVKLSDGTRYTDARALGTPLTGGEKVLARTQQALNTPTALLGTAMKPFGTDIENAFRRSAFQKYFDSRIHDTFRDDVVAHLEEIKGRREFAGPVDQAQIGRTIEKYRAGQLSSTADVTRHLQNQQTVADARAELTDPGMELMRGFQPPRNTRVIPGGQGFQEARVIMQSSIRNLEKAAGLATGAERLRLGMELAQRKQQAAVMDRLGVTPPPAMYMVSADPRIEARLRSLKGDIDHHATQVDRLTLVGDPAATAHLLEVRNAQMQYQSIMREGLQLSPGRQLAGDPGLLAAMDALEQMHLTHFENASGWLKHALEEAAIRKETYRTLYAIVPLERRGQFLDRAMYERRVAMGNMPARWTYENTRYKTTRRYDALWASFFKEKNAMDQTIALHWDLMQHGVPEARPPGVPAQEYFPEAVAPVMPVDYRVQDEIKLLGTGPLPVPGSRTIGFDETAAGRPLTQAEWREQAAGATERVWQRHIDEIDKQIARTVDSRERRSLENLRDELLEQDPQGWMDRQQARIEASRAQGAVASQALNPDWPTPQEIKLAFRDPNSRFVGTATGEQFLPGPKAARAELLKERRAELTAALRDAPPGRHADIAHNFNVDNAIHGYPLALDGLIHPIELREGMQAAGVPVETTFERLLAERIGQPKSRVQGGEAVHREKLMALAGDLLARNEAHLVAYRDLAARTQEARGLIDKLKPQRGERPARVQDQIIAARRLEELLRNMPPKLMVTGEELRAYSEAAALGHVPLRLPQEDALAHAARVGKIMGDPLVKPEWEMTTLEKIQRYRDVKMAKPAEMPPTVEHPRLAKPEPVATPEPVPVEQRVHPLDEFRAKMAKADAMQLRRMDPVTRASARSEVELALTPGTPEYKAEMLARREANDRAAVGGTEIDHRTRPDTNRYGQVPVGAQDAIAPPRYETVPGEHIPGPDVSGWATQLPDRYVRTARPVADGAYSLRWMQEHLPALHDAALKKTAYGARDFTNRVFVDYGLNTRLTDSVAKFLFTFSTYQTRTPLQFVERLATRPGQVAAYKRATDDVRENNRRNHPGLRDSMQNRWLVGDQLVDFRDILPFAKLLDPFMYPVNVGEDPHSRQDPISRFVRQATNQFLSRPSPVIEAVGRRSGVLDRDTAPGDVTQDNLQKLSTRLTGQDLSPQGIAASVMDRLLHPGYNDEAYDAKTREMLAALEIDLNGDGSAFGPHYDHRAFTVAKESKAGPLWDAARQRADAYLRANRDQRANMPGRSTLIMPREEQIGNAKNIASAAYAELDYAKAHGAGNDVAVAERQLNDVYAANPFLNTRATPGQFPTITQLDDGSYAPAQGSQQSAFDQAKEAQWNRRREESARREPTLGARYVQRSQIEQLAGTGSASDVRSTQELIDALRQPGAGYPTNNERLTEQQIGKRSTNAAKNAERAAAIEQAYGLGSEFDAATGNAQRDVLKYEDDHKDVRAALQNAGYGAAIGKGLYDEAARIAIDVPGGSDYLRGLKELTAAGGDRLKLAKDEYAADHPELGVDQYGDPDAAFQRRRIDRVGNNGPGLQGLYDARDYIKATYGDGSPEDVAAEERLMARLRDTTSANFPGSNRLTEQQTTKRSVSAEQNPERAARLEAFYADPETHKALVDRGNLRKELFAGNETFRDQYYDEYLPLQDGAKMAAYQAAHPELFAALHAIDQRVSTDDGTNPALAAHREQQVLARLGYEDPNSYQFQKDTVYFDKFSQSQRSAYDAYEAFVKTDVAERWFELAHRFNAPVSEGGVGGYGAPGGKEWFLAHQAEYNAAKDAYNAGLRKIGADTGSDPIATVNLVKGATGEAPLANGSVSDLKDSKPALGGKGKGAGKGGRGRGDGLTSEERLEAARQRGLAAYQERTKWQGDTLSGFGEATGKKGGLGPLDTVHDLNNHTPAADWNAYYGSLTSWEKKQVIDVVGKPAKDAAPEIFVKALAAAKELQGQPNRYFHGQKGAEAGIPGGPSGVHAGVLDAFGAAAGAIPGGPAGYGTAATAAAGGAQKPVYGSLDQFGQTVHVAGSHGHGGSSRPKQTVGKRFHAPSTKKRFSVKTKSTTKKTTIKTR